MAAAALAAGRKAEDIALVAVSKRQPWSAVEPVLLAGQLIFGENRVQEADERWSDVRDEHPDLMLHLIGALQTNKARDAVAFFDVIETLDREKFGQSARRVRPAGSGDAVRASTLRSTRAKNRRRRALRRTDADAFIERATRGLWSDRPGVDVHPAGRRARLPPLRAPKEDRRAKRP